MAVQFELGIGWWTNETNVAYQPYVLNPTTIYSIASNIATIPYSAGEQKEVRHQGIPFLTLISVVGSDVLWKSAGSDDFGGAVGAKEIFNSFGSQNDSGDGNGGTALAFERASDTGWILRVEQDNGFGGGGALIGKTTTVWPWTSGAPAISVLREANRCRVWMNNVKEMDVGGLDSTGWKGKHMYVGSSSVHAGKNMFLGQVLWEATSVPDDYLDYTGFVSDKASGNAAGQYSEFLDNEPGDIDDWITGSADGNTTTDSDAGTANATLRLYMATPNFTLANALGAIAYSLARGNVAAKNTIGYNGFGDGTNIVEQGLVNYPDATTYQPLTTVHPLAPGGGAWSAFTMNNLQLGYKHIVGALADSAVLTAIRGELFGCTFLSDPTAATGRRRASAGVV